jgi:hypothetical protein
VRRSGICAGLAAGLLLTGTACTPDEAKAETPSVRQIAIPEGKLLDKAAMSALVAKVDEQLASDKATAVASASARPTVVQRGSQLQTMIIHDEDNSTWAKGTYRLVVRCAGEASLVAHFSLDGASEIRQLTPCTPLGVVDQIELKIAADAKLGKILIIPAGESEAAVGYAIQKVA